MSEYGVRSLIFDGHDQFEERTRLIHCRDDSTVSRRHFPVAITTVEKAVFRPSPSRTGAVS